MEELIGILTTTSSTLPDDIPFKLTNIFQELDLQSYSKFVSENFTSLLTLEYWAWKMFSNNSYEWINQKNYLKLFESLALFNKTLIFVCDQIDIEKKSFLLMPETINIVDRIFEQIEQIKDENNLYLTIISYWFENLSYLIDEHSELIRSVIISHINCQIASRFIMTNEYKTYLTQLKQIELNITAKQLFYVKTCSLSLSCFFFCKKQTFIYTSIDILRYISTDYIEILNLHSVRMESWSKELLSCLTHLINLIHVCCWWSGDKENNMKTYLPTEQIADDYIQSLIHILSYKPFHQKIQIHRYNDETLLIDTILSFLLLITDIRDFACFIRAKTNLSEILVPIAETPGNNRINLCADALLGELICDERLKEFKITDSLCGYFFCTLEQAWKSPAQKYQRSSVTQLLRGFLSLAKNDTIQQKTADSNKVPLFIDMLDQYPIVYDILWALSFNHDIQEQLRSNIKLMNSLTHLKQEINNEHMRKITHGILWNLESNHEDQTTVEQEDEKLFDIMISYAHKDKHLIKQIYDELIRANLRVWIDFDQMHGNVMDAMAQAIERSKMVLICMSDRYRRSNYCRAEAFYAFQRQLQLVPILVQEHYKPDGWLLFLVSQLLYVDFSKHPFPTAMDMLFKELKAPIVDEPEQDLPADYRPDGNTVVTNLPLPLPLPVQLSELLPNIFESTQSELQHWLNANNLIQMSRLLSDYDGATLLYLHTYLTSIQSETTIKLLDGDSMRRLNEHLSLVELARLQKLLDQEQLKIKSKPIKKKTKKDRNENKRSHSSSCRTM